MPYLAGVFAIQQAVQILRFDLCSGGSSVRLEATNRSAYDELKDELKTDNEPSAEGEVSKSKQTVESKRGKVSTFSFRSRRRLLVTFAKLDKTRLKKPKMLTLTYPASYSDKWEKWKRDLDVFVSKHLLVRIPNVFVIWKLEILPIPNSLEIFV